MTAYHHAIGESVGGNCLYVGEGLCVDIQSGLVAWANTRQSDPSFGLIPPALLADRPADQVDDDLAWRAWAEQILSTVRERLGPTYRIGRSPIVGEG